MSSSQKPRGSPQQHTHISARPLARRRGVGKENTRGEVTGEEEESVVEVSKEELTGEHDLETTVFVCFFFSMAKDVRS